MTAKPRKSTGVTNTIRYAIDANHEHQALAEGLADTYLDVLIDSIRNQPRSLQKAIGPSQIGHPCARTILHRLNGDDEPERGVPWKPTIGTGVHAYLEEAFTNASKPGKELEGRYITEQRVTVGTLGDTPITGSTDLFDTWLGGVIDHKIVGKNTLKKYRAHGPSPEYRVQAHLYGRGWVAAGHKVQLVVIAFLPREGELTDSFIWSEPYQEQIALDALARLNGLHALLQAVGLDTALTMYPACDDTWCKWCGSGSPWPPVPTNASASTLIGMALGN